MGDYYSFAEGKFEVEALFAPGTLNGDLRPATLEIELSIGNHNATETIVIGENDWKSLKTKEWKYKD